MSFRDDNLKYWKERSELNLYPYQAHMEPEQYVALIVRLEASERMSRLGELLHEGKVAQCILDQCDFV